MREIKFRGIWVQSNRWVEGYGVKFSEKGYARIYTDTGFYEVYPESVGQYIGLKYKGQAIYEGEIIKFKHIQSIEWELSEVVYFGEMNALGSYPAFDLNGLRLKHYHFDGNALSEILDSGEYVIELMGSIFEHRNLF